MLHGGDLLIFREQARRSRVKRETGRELLRAASVLVANSRWTADLCRTVLDEIGIGENDRIRTVHLGADPSIFRPGLDQTSVRKRYDLPNRRWLVTVARLTRHKGIDIGIRLLAALKSTHPDLGYLIIGAGEELPGLQELSRALGVEERVRFLTDVPDRDLPALYNCAEVYLGLSKVLEQRVEGFGIALVEASASGLPVLAARTGGIGDAVRHGETGVLVEANRPDQAVIALRGVLDDPVLSARLGTGGRRAVEKYYNWERVVAELARIGDEAGRVKRAAVVRP
jgi:phosphatidylinositol alpha-1,6-mannosyltransferase